MDFSRLEKYLNTLEDAFDFKSFDIAVCKNGEEIYRYLYGCSDIEGKRPASKDDLMWIYSMTKVITCVGALRLVERGLLDLDDPVSKYLPEYEFLTVKTKDGIQKAQNVMTVRHLFSMRSGLSYDLWSPALKEARKDENASTRQLAAAIAKDPLMFEPGTNYLYSLSHDVLAAIIEIVSGQTFHEYLQENIFEPLGMKNVGFHPTVDQKKRFCAQYSFDPYTYTASLTDGTCDYRLSEKYESGGAGLFATNDDYMKFIKVMANYGVAQNGYVLIKKETIDLMRTEQITIDERKNLRPGYTYGLGVRIMRDRSESPLQSLSPVGEFGWAGAASSYCVIDTDNNMGIVFTTNMLSCAKAGNEIHPHIRNLVYDAVGIKK